jgi:hypothetical protein
VTARQKPLTVARRIQILLVPGIVLFSAALSGCGGPSRSVAAYCSYFYGEGSQLRDRFIRSSSADGKDPFAALSSLFVDLPEAASFLHQLSLRAPQEIAPEVEVLAKALENVAAQSGSSASDPLGALGSALVGGVETAGAEQRVNAYTLQHCGTPPGASGQSTATASSAGTTGPVSAATGSASPEAPAPAPGSTVLSTNVTGSANVISNGHGFSIIEDGDSSRESGESGGKEEAKVTTFNAAGQQLTGLSSNDLTGACGVDDVIVPGRGRLILTEVISDQQAEGIKPATGSLSLKAWNADTGAEVWNTTVVPTSQNQPTCQYENGQLQDFGSTRDGRWGLYGGGLPRNDGEAMPAAGKVLNLDTGEIIKGVTANSLLGDYPITVHVAQDGSTYRAIDPSSGAVLGTNVNSFEFVHDGHALELASGGMPFPYTGEGGAQPPLLSSDNQRLVGSVEEGSRGNSVIAYSLPSFRVSFRRPVRGFYPRVVADGGGLAIESLGDSEEPGGKGSLVAFDDSTGSQVWKLPGSVCGITNTQMMITVNNQTAIIDLKTGKQVSFSQESCPTILPGGISVSGEGSSNEGSPAESHALKVTQVLTP